MASCSRVGKGVKKKKSVLMPRREGIITVLTANARARCDAGMAGTMKSEVAAVPGYLSTPLPCQLLVYTRPPPPPATIMDHAPGAPYRGTWAVRPGTRLISLKVSDIPKLLLCGRWNKSISL
ncbi:hypothetical protein V1478_012133 [Vespula squamosa]|uniref:Uncharacterized protein n=1 Tax=Vespula squamosa TaxID=30214 RepID=A0ABD2ACC4_VESSQ